MWEYNYTPGSDELYHWGIKGMQWGKRRYQNSDGSLTPAGKKRYAKETYKNEKKQAFERHQSGLKNLQSSGKGNDVDAVLKISKQYDDDRAAAKAKYKTEKESIKAEKNEAMKKAIKKASFHDGRDTAYMKAASQTGKTYASHILAGALGGTIVASTVNQKKYRTGKQAATNLLIGASIGVVSGTTTATKKIVRGNNIARKSYGVN